MFPRKKENEKPKTEDGGQKNVQGPTPNVECRSETEGGEQKTEELQKQIESLQKEKDDIFAKLQRVAADYDNYQKRAARQTADSIAYEKDKIIKAILPVLDDFERVLAHTENAEAVVKGIDIVYEHLKGVLCSEGLEEIESAGEKFDPTHHQALTQRTEENKEDGVVLEELQKGYKLNGRVIRASRVVVNKAAASPAGSGKIAEEEETKDTQ